MDTTLQFTLIYKGILKLYLFLYSRTFPFKKKDPLVFNDKLPDIYVSGGESEFFTSVTNFSTKDVTIIGLPDFFKTFSFSILDTKTNKVIEYKLK